MSPDSVTSRDWPCFILDGEVIEARGIEPTTTLLQYLRERLGRHGTKEGCAEGDCGACTVAIADLDGDRVRYRTVNSCIQFVGTVDGKEVVTAQSLRAADGTLHPVQRAMVECHGSQCGFCTPGFVMSMFVAYVNHALTDRGAVLDSLSGNLCRCTGYRPIIDAALSVEQYPEPAHWSRVDAQSAERRTRLASIAPAAPLVLTSGAGFEAPQTLDQLAERYVSNPDAVLLAGGTDVGLWVTKQMRDLPRILYLGNVRELDTIDATANAVTIGAAVSLTHAFQAILGHYPALGEIVSRFGSVPIRNAGTLVGNIANGSPIGDSMPLLIALGSTVRLRRGREERILPLEALYIDYQVKALQPGELIVSVTIPLLPPSTIVASYKVAKRFDQDISGVCGAYVLDVTDGQVQRARVAYGGMAPIPRRATHAERELTGKPWVESTFAAAATALTRDYTPITDMRASQSYRTQVAANLLRRLYLDRAPEGRSVAVTVFDPALA